MYPYLKLVQFFSKNPGEQQIVVGALKSGKVEEKVG